MHTAEWEALVAAPEAQCKANVMSCWAEHVTLSQGSEVTLSVGTFTTLISSRCLCPSFSQTLALHTAQLHKHSAQGLSVPLLTFDLSLVISNLSSQMPSYTMLVWNGKLQPLAEWIFNTLVLNWFSGCTLDSTHTVYHLKVKVLNVERWFSMATGGSRHSQILTWTEPKPTWMQSETAGIIC